MLLLYSEPWPEQSRALEPTRVEVRAIQTSLFLIDALKSAIPERRSVFLVRGFSRVLSHFGSIYVFVGHIGTITMQISIGSGVRTSREMSFSDPQVERVLLDENKQRRFHKPPPLQSLDTLKILKILRVLPSI